MLEKLKPLVQNDAIFHSVLLLLVAIASFGLGRQSVLDSAVQPTGAPITPTTMPASLQQLPVIQEEIITEQVETGKLVASKSGSKYHLLSCPGAKQIKESNKIYFATPAEASAAGYTPAANCPDLQ